MRTWILRNMGAALVSLSLASMAGADAVVVVVDGGSLPPSTVRYLAEQGLRGQGVRVIQAPQLEGVFPVGPDIAEIASELRATNVFAVRLGRLDEKVVIGLEELDVPHLDSLASATLTAWSVDESERVLERLAMAVVQGVPVAETARIDTVTEVESEAYRKKPGEHLLVLGLNLAPVGGSIGWSYEADRWRLGVLYQGAEDQMNYLGVDGAYLLSKGDVSPYVGVGLGLVGEDDTHAGAKLEAGVEAFRLHGVRLMAGVYAIVGFEHHDGDDQVSPGVFVRLGF
jgi:hypothetical protein